MRTGSVRPIGSLKAGVWTRVYSTVLSATATSITISGLDGDTDCEYILRCRFVNAAGTEGVSYLICPNNDTVDGHYGYQYLLAAGTSKYAGGADAVYGGYLTLL